MLGFRLSDRTLSWSRNDAQASMSSSQDTEQSRRHQTIEELEGRIETLEALDDAKLGSFTKWDWVICVVGAVILPAIALWWFAG